MRRKLSPRSECRLEGLCEAPADDGRGAGNRIRIGRASAGIERLEARLIGQAFSPHRHDTYAIGVTLSGVQTFRYRGTQRVCLPGQCHVLHPDETHDGGAGAGTGFGYRIVYIDPALVQQALGGKALPFVADPIVEKRVFHDALPPALWRLDEPIDDVQRIEIVTAVADLLDRAARPGARKQGPLRLASLLRVRDLIVADPAARHSIATLEAVSGLDRWALARQFRAAFGTCPSSFRTMRQLDEARRMIRAGLTLAEAAVDSGFADQSHMSRLFKRAYGLTPAKWAAALVCSDGLPVLANQPGSRSRS
jgi:AraC-like DNA-binding protein